MQTETLTPSRISRQVATNPVKVPDYNWTNQSRFDGEAIKMGHTTHNTVQTFDYQGKPKDSASDQD